MRSRRAGSMRSRRPSASMTETEEARAPSGGPADALVIAGLVPISTVDWPNHLSATDVGKKYTYKVTCLKDNISKKITVKK